MTVALVPAAGRGARVGAPLNKLFLPLDGRPVLVWTLDRLSACACIDSIVVAAQPAEIDAVRSLIDDFGIRGVCRVVPGGAERQDSVRLALESVPDGTEIVVVHDAARPLVSADIIQRTVAAARAHGAALSAIPAVDTVKRTTDGVFVSATLPRQEIWLAQTPQAFRREILDAAYAHADETGFHATDDASLVEHLGRPVHLVEGHATNLKVTAPVDLAAAAAILASTRQADLEGTPAGTL